MKKFVFLISLLTCFTASGDLAAQKKFLFQRAAEGDAWFDRGYYERAERIYEAVAADARKNKKNYRPAQSLYLQKLAKAKAKLGKLEDAEALYREAEKIVAEEGSISEVTRIQAINGLADVYRQLGEHDKAGKILGDPLVAQEELMGPDHPALAITLNKQILLLRDQGQIDAAMALVPRTLAVAKWRSVRMEVMKNTGDLHAKLDEQQAAQKMYAQSLEVRERWLWNNGFVEHKAEPLSHVEFLEAYAGFLLKVGETAESTRLTAKAAEIRARRGFNEVK